MKGLRIDLPQQPFWIALGYNIEMKCRPLSSATIGSLQAKAARLAREMTTLAEAEKLAAVVDAKDLSDDEIRAGLGEMYTAVLIGQAVIVEWSGVFAGAAAAPVNDETVAAAMRLPLIGPRFLAEYFRPYGLVVEEGNGSAPPPAGSRAAAPTIATDAEHSETTPAGNAATARPPSKGRTRRKGKPR
ncbi:hypothetical protein [Parvibaculum sp.]|uniref:hypothetical protein n=1 Tax=Parvibaculum sp. TaxID=2024848 RepID=UPI001D2E0513|nr:hypothetical protein [Parvibaculum sp.]MBX3488865.1 hypothetical protein [Parvibaculum sp.]